MKKNLIYEFDEIISNRIKKLNEFSSKYRILKTGTEKNIETIYFFISPFIY